jgi:hypothetical protein
VAPKKKKNAAVKRRNKARSWWLKSVILATQEAEIRRIKVRSLQIVPRDPILKKSITKNGWWLKVKALRSNPSTAPLHPRKEESLEFCCTIV